MTIWIPEKCVRERDDCCALALIESDDGKSFHCIGHNDGTTRTIKQDKFRVCFKNQYLDEMSDWDERDVKDMMSVLSQGLSADANISLNDSD